MLFFFLPLNCFFSLIMSFKCKISIQLLFVGYGQKKKKKGIKLEGSTSNLGAYSWHEKCNLVSSFLRREKVSPDFGIERKNHYFHIFQLTNWLILCPRVLFDEKKIDDGCLKPQYYLK